MTLRDKLLYIGGISGIISLIISLVLVLYHFELSFCEIEKTSGFWGIVVSAVALVIACYLVFLAMDADRRVKRLSMSMRKIKKEQESLSKSLIALVDAQKTLVTKHESLVTSQESFTVSRKSFAESMWDSYTLQLAILGKIGKAGSIAVEMRRARGKLGYLFPMLDDNKRLQCLDDLAKDGDGEDIPALKKIADNQSESPEIRNKANDAIAAIKTR